MVSIAFAPISVVLYRAGIGNNTSGVLVVLRHTAAQHRDTP